MPATITIQDVKDFYPNELPDSVITRYIGLLAQADTCLDKNSVPEVSQELLKLTAIAHLLTVQQGGGVKSEQDMDGASVTFKGTKGASPHIEQLRSMQGYSCVQGLVDKPKRFAASVGC